MKEIWKPIPDFPEYFVSNRGIVISHKLGKIRILKPGFNGYGYKIVSICGENGPITRAIHRLVLLAFIGKPPPKYETNHKNGVKTDNRVENLEWITHKENVQHSFDNNFQISARGEQNGKSKLKNGEVWLIKRLLGIETKILTIAKMFNVDSKTIRNIHAGKTWKHIN